MDVALPLDNVMLALGIGGSVAVLGGALALGIRHGFDWDHIAAITDITSTTVSVGDPHETWLTDEPGVMLTDESHHSLAADPLEARAVAEAQRVIGTAPEPVVVGARMAASERLSPGAAAQAAPFAARGSLWGWPLPRFLAQHWPPFLLGIMYALGHSTMVTALGLLAILASGFLPGWIDPIMERVVGITLIFLAAYLSYSLYRFFRRGEEFRIRSRWMLLFAGIHNGFNWLRARIRGEHRHEHVQASQQYGVKTAYGVGLIHGIGAETGTQVLIIATAVGAGSKVMSVATLLTFVVGLIISNSILTITTTTGFVSAGRKQAIYVGVGLLAAVFSLAIGLVFLFRAGGVLPDLGHFFRWIGGPDA